MGSAKLRQEMKDLELCKKITKTLSGTGLRRVVLAGETGIGKTRLARKVAEHATKKGLCYLTLWLHLNKKFEDEWSLYENIAFQIDVYDRDYKGDMEKSDLLRALKEKISAGISRKKTSAEENIKKLAEVEKKHASSDVTMPYLLVVLDDEGCKTTEEYVMKDLGLENFLAEDNLDLKFIITTRREREGNTIDCEEETESHDTESEDIIEFSDTDNQHDTKIKEENDSLTTYDCIRDLELHTADESQALLDTLTEDSMRDLFESRLKDVARDLLESLQKDWKIDEPLTSRVAQKSMNFPAAIVVLAKSINSITDENTFKRLSPKQERILKEALSPCEQTYSDSGYNPMLHLAYKLLETDNTLKNAIIDCFWHTLDFFNHCGCVYYRDLIAQWILEGYFDPVRSVKMAYKDGHDILLELINRGILKIQEDDMIVPELAMSTLTDLRHHGFLGKSRLRYALVDRGNKNKGLGKITQTDDMIKTVQAKKGEGIYTILVSGKRLRRERPQMFFQQMGDLEVLSLFAPTVDPLIPSLINLKKLRVLVIRDCDLLSDIEELKCLQELQALEISGASSVKAISDDFFKAIPDLQSLNLSGLGIISSPSSISQLRELHSLILRDCRLLEDLPDIDELCHLEVIDVRGAHKLETCFGKRYNTSRNRNFYHLHKLRLLDFSESKIRRLPLFHDAADTRLLSLTRLSLHNCSKLIRLPNLEPLSSLQILDLSGMTSLVEISSVCFKNKKELKILNLSGTNFTKLPYTITGLSSLSQLLLRDNFNVEALPNIEQLTSLEVLDVSGCSKLHHIEGSFKNMFYLREVNLSGTKIKTLPELPSTISGISNLSQLLLRDSSNLEALPDIEGLTSLEVFDVSGCTKVHRIEGSFKYMSYLCEVNLSGTRIEILPELPEKSSICCPKLVVLPDSRRLIHDTWSQVKEAMTNGMSKSLSFSATVDRIQEISRKKLGRVDEFWAYDCPEKKCRCREQLHQGHVYNEVYVNTIPFIDTRSGQNVLQIQGSNGIEQDKEALAKAEFVAFLDHSAASLISIFNNLKSVTDCWLEMCGDIEILFSGVDEECLENLETLSITNSQRLENISSSCFKNLKKLNLDCCPSIITLFPDASQLPSNLEVLKIKFCEKLEKVFAEEVELPNLHTLCLLELPVLSTIGATLPNLVTYKEVNCPKLTDSKENFKRGNSSSEIRVICTQ